MSGVNGRYTELAESAKAIAHPLRLAILDQVAEGPRSPNQIAGELGEPLGNVSYHVRLLADLGALELTRTVPRRGAVEHFYGLSDRGGHLVALAEAVQS